MKQFEQVLRRRIRDLLRKHSYKEANDLIDEFRNRVGLNEESQGYQLECLIGTSQWKDAKALGERLKENYPRSPRIVYLLSLLYRRTGNYRDAVEAARRQVELFASKSGEFNLAMCLIANGNFDEAYSLLRRFDQDSPRVLSQLGWLFERKHNYPKAIFYYGETLKRDPKNEFVKRHLETCQAMVIDSQSFLGEMEALNELDEEIPENLLPAYFKSHIEAGNEGEMRAYLQKNWRRFHPALCRETGWACYNANNLDLAFQLFLEFFKHDQTQFKLTNSMEYCARKLGRVEELKQLYYQLAKEDPKWFGRIGKLKKST